MHRFTRSLLLAALAAMISAGCTTVDSETGVNTPAEASADATSTTSATSNADSTNDLGSDGSAPIESPGELPIAAAVTEVAGYTEIAVSTAVNNARFDSIVTCMTSQGWEFGYADLPEAGPSSEPIRYFGSQIQYYLDQIDVLAGGGGEDLASQGTEADRGRGSVEFDQDQFECWVQAETQFPDPLIQLWTWVAEETTDLDTRVRQDDRIVAAREASVACLAASGYEFTSIEAAGNHFNDLADQTWIRFTNGTISGDVARSELLSISEQMSGVEEYVRTCDIELAAVQETVRAEYEEAFLDENGARIALLAAEYAELLTRYLEFMPTQPDG